MTSHYRKGSHSGHQIRADTSPGKATETLRSCDRRTTLRCRGTVAKISHHWRVGAAQEKYIIPRRLDPREWGWMGKLLARPQARSPPDQRTAPSSPYQDNHVRPMSLTQIVTPKRTRIVPIRVSSMGNGCHKRGHGGAGRAGQGAWRGLVWMSRLYSLCWLYLSPSAAGQPVVMDAYLPPFYVDSRRGGRPIIIVGSVNTCYPFCRAINDTGGYRDL